MAEENIVVVEQGSNQAQQIAKAMSSSTSADIFNQLSLGPMSATALAEKTGVPLTTVKYHLENLLSAGLIEILNTKWSVKGRQIKIYGVKDQVVVLAPKRSSAWRSIAEKYGTVAGALAIGSSLILAIPRVLMEASNTIIPKDVSQNVTQNMLLTSEINDAALDIGSMMPMIHTAVQVFFATSLLVLGILMAFEIYRSRHIK